MAEIEQATRTSARINRERAAKRRGRIHIAARTDLARSGMPLGGAPIQVDSQQPSGPDPRQHVLEEQFDLASCSGLNCERGLRHGPGIFLMVQKCQPIFQRLPDIASAVLNKVCGDNSDNFTQPVDPPLKLECTKFAHDEFTVS